jgi:uncharacterized membrane protein YeiH/ABC-type nitrate/sulfonate/bicarbonate transport system substrate-binding protein
MSFVASSYKRYCLLRVTALCAIFVLTSFLPLVIAYAHANAGTPLRVQLLWTHQTQFAGYYFAETHSSHGRDATGIELVEGGPGINPFDRLIKGEADVAIGWLADALAARAKGADIVNVAQIFRRPGMALVCSKAAGIRGAADLAGRSVGVWHVGDEISVHLWLQRAGVPESSIKLVAQAANAQDLISGRLPCATVMLYNEYWTLLRAGIKATDLMLVRFGEEKLGMLEDGLYVRRTSLDDPAFRGKLAAFLKATAAGWRQARESPDEAVALTLSKSPALDVAHQRRMLETILNLIPSDAPFGLLVPADYERTVNIYAHDANDAAGIRRAADAGWTHRIWYQAGLDGGDPFTVATRHYLATAMGSTWFYLLDLIGTAAFGLAGFMRARQRRYDLWGAFILTLLPAVGGGTLRDLLVGGDRHPPFIFHDPAYMSVVFGVVIFGTLVSRFLSAGFTESRGFERFLAVFDTVGVTVFTLVGAKVALLAGLAWYWIPICAAVTCAGGGMLLDVVTGREPRTFQGEPYEEIAVAGGLLLYLCLTIANHYEHSPWMVSTSILLTLVAVYAARMAVIVYDIKSYRLGDRQAPPAER